jgi:putative ABC transport system substrate-binding protein
MLRDWQRKSGNLTGVNFLNTELVAKQLGLLRELIPGTARVAVLVNQTNITAETTLKTVEAAALAMGLQLQTVSASTNAEINTACANLSREHPDALSR